MAVTAKPLPHARARAEEHEDPREHLMHDPEPRGEMNAMVLESMHTTTWRYWAATGVLFVPGADLLLLCLVLPDRQRPGRGRREPPSLLGHLPGQYRLLDRHQPRRHIHLGHPAGDEDRGPAPIHAGGRTDDHLWPGAGRRQHLHAHGPRLAGVLAVPIPQRTRSCGRISTRR